MSNDTSFHIALYNPEIPQNTGNIGRLSLGLGARLHLIKPLGFDISEKSVRRAGLDYWKNVNLKVHNSIEDFLEWADHSKIILMSTKSSSSIASARIKPGCILMFGPETRGLPVSLLKRFQCYKIPMRESIRSYNLSNSVAIASYFVLQHLDPDWCLK